VFLRRLCLLLIPSAAEILGFPTDGGQCEQSDAYGKLLQNPSVARADGINRRDSAPQRVFAAHAAN